MNEKNSLNEISKALKVMELSRFINLRELKKRYKELANLHHPDFGGDEEKMVKINEAFKILKDYMTNFRFTFTKEEIYKQFPQDAHADKFRF